MKKLKIGIVGCGRISEVHKESFMNLGYMVVVVFAVDKDISKAKQFSESFKGCRYSDKIEDIVHEQLDVVHILTPHYLHKTHVELCLRAGFHVLTEKPIATKLEDAIQMKKTADETGKQLGVIFQNRYIDGIREAKKMLEQGVLGKVTGVWSTLHWHRPPSYYEIDWKGSWQKEGGGVVIDQAIHSIDLVRYLMGKEISTIKGQIDTRVLTMIEVEDVASAAITFDDGTVYSFFACNYFTVNSPIRIEWSTEKGSILLEGDIVKIKIGENERIISPAVNQGGEGESYWSNFHYYQIKDFYECILENRPVPIEPTDAIKTLEAVLGIYQSSNENKEIRLR